MTSPFEQTMLPHLDAAYNLAHWLLRNEQDARDSVQEAYLRAFKAFHGFRGGDGRAWLLTIVRNVCYTHLRRMQRQLPTEPFDESQHGRVNEPAELAVLDRQEIDHARLDAALTALPVDLREVLVLHEIEGLAYKEIAAVVGIPLGTVMSRLSRARLRLNRALLGPAQSEERP
ncbi:MAG: sigma-70 family RNA polymerase sigma factor [Candidatus Didemnitutus sp.]|nr:sigma-70 family RNA polymerase sigma factor [Candidatus Didemnitutus sp.]